MEETIYWIALKKLPQIGDITFINLLKENGNIAEIFNHYNCETKLKESALKFAENEIKNCKNSKVNILKFNDPHYPDLLKEIHSPPPFLYYIGNIDILKNYYKLAVIGSRNPTDYGKNICIDIVKQIAKSGVVTVSGFARGIDTLTHKSTLEVNGHTIGVLGNGFEYIYPSTNKKLFNTMRGNGLFLTEFSLETRPEPVNFPRRNRIISGLAKGVIVIEASKKSGTLITADFALNQGRDVFVVPGNVYSFKSKGTNFLIKNGAYLVENGKDILDIMFPELTINKTETKKTIKFEDKTLEKIYDLIKEEPLNLDEIILKANIGITELLPIITQLQMLEYIKEHSGKFYVKNS